MDNILFSSINTTGVIGISYDTLSSFVGQILYFSDNGEILIVDPKTTDPSSMDGIHLNKYLSHSGNNVIEYVFKKHPVTPAEQKISLNKAHTNRLSRVDIDWAGFVDRCVIIQQFQVDVEPEPEPEPDSEPDNYTKACYAILNLLMITNKIMSVITEMNYSLSPFAVDNRSWWWRRGVNVETWLYYVKDCYKVNSGNQQLLSTYFLDEIINAPAGVNAKDLCKLLFNNYLKMVTKTIMDDDKKGTLKILGFPISQHNSPLLDKRYDLSKLTTDKIIYEAKTNVAKTNVAVEMKTPIDPQLLLSLLSLLPVITYEVVKESSGGVLFTPNNGSGHIILKSVRAKFTNSNKVVDEANGMAWGGDSLHDFTTGNRPDHLIATMKPYPKWWNENIGTPLLQTGQWGGGFNPSNWTSDTTMKDDLFYNLDINFPDFKSARVNHRLTANQRADVTYATSNAAPSKLVKMYRSKELLTIGQLIDSAIQMGDPKKFNELLLINITHLKINTPTLHPSAAPITRRHSIMDRLNKIINRLLGQDGQDGGFATNMKVPTEIYKLTVPENKISLIDGHTLIIDDINKELVYDVVFNLSTGKLFNRTIIKYIILQTYETSDKKIGFRLIITEYKVTFGKMWDPKHTYQWEADYLTSKIRYNKKSYKFRTGRSLDSNMIKLDSDEKLYIKSILKTIFPNKDIETFLLLEGCPLFTSGGIVASKIKPDPSAPEDIKRICEISGQHLKFTGDGTQETLWILYQQILKTKITKLNNDELSAIKDYINTKITKKKGHLEITLPLNVKIDQFPLRHEQWTKTNQNWEMNGGGKVKPKKSKNMKGGFIYTPEYLHEELQLYLMDYTDIYNSYNIIDKLQNEITTLCRTLSIELNKYCLCDLDEWLDIGEILFVSLKKKYDIYINDYINKLKINIALPSLPPAAAAAPSTPLSPPEATRPPPPPPSGKREDSEAVFRSPSPPRQPTSVLRPNQTSNGDPASVDTGTRTPIREEYTGRGGKGHYLKKSKRNNNKKSRRKNKKSRRNKNKKSRRNKNKKSRRKDKKSRRNKNKSVK